MSNQRVLILGNLGFIGSHTADELVKRGYDVFGMDNLSTGNLTNTNPIVVTVQADVNDYESLARVMEKVLPDYVFHYAAVVGVQRTLHNPISVLDDIKGFENVCELSVKYGVQRVLFSSSSEVYGDPVSVPLNEDTSPLNARLPYAVVKNVGEKFLESYHQERGLNYTIFRFFNCIGTRQRPDFVVSKFLKQAMLGEDITIYGDGTQYRTFMSVHDNVVACCNALLSKKHINQTYNVGGTEKLDINELAKLIIEVTKSSSKIKYLPSLKKGDMQMRSPDVTKMGANLFPANKLTPVKEVLQEMVR